ncbi:hydroxyisourate hydrolase [Nonomuraea sp. NPDC001023]
MHRAHRAHASIGAGRRFQVSPSSITPYALDVAYGRPAAGIPVLLQHLAGGCWQTAARAATDEDGLVRDWGSKDLEQGHYRLLFNIDHYFATLGLSVPYPTVTANLRLQDVSVDWQMQLTLAPHSYVISFCAHASHFRHAGRSANANAAGVSDGRPPEDSTVGRTAEKIIARPSNIRAS